MAGIGGRSLSELPSSGALRALIGKDDAVPDGPLDMDYQRTVAEIVEQQQGAGYMYGKGALDKNDLLFLREQADREKEAEMGLIESEALQYAALRARVEVVSDQTTTLHATRHQPSAAALLAAAKAKEKHRPLLKLVAIAKKPRLASAVVVDSSVSVTVDVHKTSDSASVASAAAALLGGSSSSSNPSPPEPVAGSCSGGAPTSGPGNVKNVETDVAAVMETAGSGLLGLFGDYDSDDDSEGEGNG